MTPYIFDSQHNCWSNDGRYLTCSAKLIQNKPKQPSGTGLLYFRVPRELRK